MAIKKQEFYEGAALHMLARNGGIASIRYEAPFFVLNDSLLVYLKYSTRGRSPWGFTFMPDEQSLLQIAASKLRVVIGLICGADGVAAFAYESYRAIAVPGKSAIHIACYRQHGEHYAIKGPDGKLHGKVPVPVGRTASRVRCPFAYLGSRDGSPAQLLTKGSYDVISLSRADEKGGWLYFIASPENATQRYLYRVRLDGAVNRSA